VNDALPISVECIQEASSTEHTIDSPGRSADTPANFRAQAHHPRASVFHSAGWTQALRDTYDYESFAFPSDGPALPATSGITLARVRSWLTGKRLISLPFSDHCTPLVSGAAELQSLLAGLKPLLAKEDWNYIEIRPVDNSFDDVLQAAGFERCDEYLLHRLQLDAPADVLFHQFHKSSVQHRVRRAERLGLVCETGRSPKLIRDFFQLMASTRRRQFLPPQPFAWFENLVRCMGEDGIEIRVAYKDALPIAAVLNIKAFGHVCYKYSCSDLRFKSMNATCLLLWHTVQDACRDGFQMLDLGRSAIDNSGLVRFKSNWAGEPTRLTYWRLQSPARRARPSRFGDWKVTGHHRILGILPQPILNRIGATLYKHIG
jgi:Acetyltransferase (GNAT) domain